MGQAVVEKLSTKTGLTKKYFQKLKWMTIIILFFQASISNSFPNLNCKKNQFSDLAQLSQKISVVETDSRELFANYARRKRLNLTEVENQFGATGVVSCGGPNGTAQITGNRLVITSAKHIFFDKKCNPYPHAEECFFAFRGNNGQLKKFAINKTTLRTGACTPTVDSSTDWAVAELTTPVSKEINPYKVSRDDISLSVDTPLTQVSGYSDNFHPEMNKPKYITECKVRDIANYVGVPIQSDCDSGPGASGSAQLIESSPGDFTIAAIHVGHSADAYDRMPYNADDYYNISIPVANAFKVAIDEAIQNSNKRLMVSGKKPVQASSIGY